MKKIVNTYNYQYHYNQLLIKIWSLFVRESSKYSCAIRTSGFCGHIVGLLYSLAHKKACHLKSVQNDIAKTSLPQTWHIPRGNFYKCFTNVLKIFCEEKKFAIKIIVLRL